MGLVFIAVGPGAIDALCCVFHALAIAFLVMSGAIIWNNVTGLNSTRRFVVAPPYGLAFVVGAAGLLAFLGSWALLKLADALWATQPVLVGMLVVNA